MKKTSKISDTALYCSRCGRKTPHYTNSKGEVRCSICQTVAKIVKVKTPKEVIFEADEEFENELNPVTETPDEKIDEELDDLPL